MKASPGHLLVRAGRPARRLAARPGRSRCSTPATVFPVPALEPAVRGVAIIRGRILPLVHLGALLEGGPCPAARPDTGVLRGARRAPPVSGGRGRRVRALRAGPAGDGGSALPWAAAVARTDAGLVPLLDLAALGARYLGGLRRMTTYRRRHPARDLPRGNPGVRVRHPAGRAHPPARRAGARFPRRPTFSRASCRTRVAPFRWWTCGSASSWPRPSARRPG